MPIVIGTHTRFYESRCGSLTLRKQSGVTFPLRRPLRLDLQRRNAAAVLYRSTTRECVLLDADPQVARDEAFFAGADLNDGELKQAAHDDQERKEARLPHAEAMQRNLGLGHDLRAGLMDPTPGQLHALKALVCHLLAADYRDIIAFGAGWTDQQRQQPVGDTGRHEPRHPDAIVDAELQTALDDPDPLRGIAQLASRWAAAFVLDPDGITRTKALGTERMARKLTDALPGGDNALRAAAWEFVRPMLSPALAAMHRDAFLTDQSVATTVRLTEHRSDSAIDDLNLDDD